MHPVQSGHAVNDAVAITNDGAWHSICAVQLRLKRQLLRTFSPDIAAGPSSPVLPFPWPTLPTTS